MAMVLLDQQNVYLVFVLLSVMYSFFKSVFPGIDKAEKARPKHSQFGSDISWRKKQI